MAKSMGHFRDSRALSWLSIPMHRMNPLSKALLCTTLDSVNPVLYPSIDTILIKLCVLLTMPVASATAEMPFSVLRRLKTYVRSTMKNDRLSSLGLMHILTEILKWTCTKQWRCSYLLKHEGQILDNFKKFLSIKVIKIVLDSMLYETLKWPQIAPFCISSKKKSQTPSPSQELWRAHY